jgi:hypothetical protein
MLSQIPGNADRPVYGRDLTASIEAYQQWAGEREHRRSAAAGVVEAAMQIGLICATCKGSRPTTRGAMICATAVEVYCQPALENASPQPVKPSSVSTLTSTVCTSFFGSPPA